MNEIKDLISKIRPYINIKEQLLMVLLIIITSFVGLSIPQIVKVIIDNVIGEKKYNLLVYGGTGLLFATIFVSILEFLQTFVLARTNEKVSRRLRSKIYQKFTALDKESRQMVKPGTLISLFNNDVSQVNSFISSFMSGVVAQIILLVILVTTMVLISPKLTFYSIVTLPLYFIFFSVLAQRMKEYSVKRQVILSKLNNSLHEDIIGMDTIQAYNSQDGKNIEFNSTLKYIYDNNISLSIVNSLLGQIASLIAGLGNVVVLWVGTLMIKNGDFTIGGIMAFTSYLGRMYSPILTIVSMRQNLQSVGPSIDRIFHFLNYESKIKEISNPIKLEDENIDINLNNVGLTVKDGSKILDDISINIPFGSYIAVIGESGSGKTTLGSLLNRTLEFSEGSIRINNEDIRKYSLDSIREKIGVVYQENTLFSTSIRDNIRFYNDTFDDDNIKKFLDLSACNFVYSSPKDLDTILGDQNNFSSGEKQRINICRALIRQYPVLFLDEPTSALDNNTREQIIQNILKIREGKTTILVSHKIEDVVDAEKIYLMDKGKIVASGRHDELLQNSQQYKLLYKEKLA